MGSKFPWTSSSSSRPYWSSPSSSSFFLDFLSSCCLRPTSIYYFGLEGLRLERNCRDFEGPTSILMQIRPDIGLFFHLGQNYLPSTTSHVILTRILISDVRLAFMFSSESSMKSGLFEQFRKRGEEDLLSSRVQRQSLPLGGGS